MKLFACLLALACVVLVCEVAARRGKRRICYNACKDERGEKLSTCYFRCRRSGPARTGLYNRQKLFKRSANEEPVRQFRDYYIQAEETFWDYLPSGENLVDNNNDYLEDSLRNKTNRIGSKLWKYVYKRYTNDSYTTEIKSEKYQGIVGPMIYAETGDVIRIHLRNLCHEPISIHPHGAFYLKGDEGAHYLDNTSGEDKLDDRIPYGHNRTMTWRILKEYSPTADDPNCLIFAVHSHNHAEYEVYAGLLTLMVSCKPGILTGDPINPRRRDVDAERVLYFESIDEGLSLLTQRNLGLCGNPTLCRELYNDHDDAFMESLKKDSINGYMYGNLPDLSVCAGDKVAWYLFSLNAEIHAAEIHGHQLRIHHQRKSTVGIWSATFVTAESVSTTPGRWLVSCQNLEHFRNGMTAYLNVKDCNKTLNDSPTNRNVKYYIAAEPVTWNYAPSGLNKYEGGSLTAPGTASYDLFVHGTDRIGGEYMKSRFVQYTDDTFTAKVQRGPEDLHLGILGPPIRAAVGDKITVVLKNKTPFNVSLYMQGVKFEKNQDGLLEKEGVPGTQPDGKIVQPGQIDTYKFKVTMSESPDEDDAPCTSYLYHSAVNIEKDINTGLLGPVLICKTGMLDRTANRQRNIDKEFYLLFADMDENHSKYLQQNVAKYAANADVTDSGFIASNIMRSINGRSYANLEGLKMCQGNAVVWHILAVGANEALHGIKFNGNNILTNGVNRDSYIAVPGGTFTGLMGAENMGNWSVSCHNTDHFTHGEKAIYTVDCCETQAKCEQMADEHEPHSGTTRVYYIAAALKKWNYSPKTIHPLTGEDYSLPNSSHYNRVRTDDGFIGSEYNKALYVEYTDETFTVEKPKLLDLGILGPVVRCEVGDTVKVVFKNMAGRKYSINPHGLRYTKANEGQHYWDGHTSPGDGVAPGDTYTYTWTVPEDAGPAEGGPNCHGSLYQSGVDPVKDLFSGLVGPMVICKHGKLRKDGTRTDKVKREYFLLMMAWDENRSWYLGQNIAEYAAGDDQTSDEKIEANKYDSINGFVYNNLPGLLMCEGEYVAWYGLALGVSEDYHDIHFHGNMYIHRTNRAHRGDVLDVFPSVKETAVMFAYATGTYLVHCHVAQHTIDGMVATYTVYPKNDSFCQVN